MHVHLLISSGSTVTRDQNERMYIYKQGLVKLWGGVKRLEDDERVVQICQIWDTFVQDVGFM